jgi:hypothetical protein
MFRAGVEGGLRCCAKANPQQPDYGIAFTTVNR